MKAHFAAILCILVLVGCNESRASIVALDSGTDIDGGSGLDGATSPDGASLDCVPDPKTHEEILNRCSNSEKIDKTPSLPLLLPDGALPALPP
jgi:hypothetical protein